MDKELKAKVIPVLRKKGFTGSFPHFRRIKENYVDVLGFQFSQWGPQFYIEIATAPSNGITYSNGSHLPPEKIKHSHCANRTRIGDGTGNATFDFENENFEEVIEKVIKSLTEAEQWWTKN